MPYAKKKRLDVYNEDILKIDFRKKLFDVVTLWQVIEHVPDPIAVLKKIATILKPGGILIMATPDTDSLGFLIGQADWFHLDSPRHLVLFNKQSIIYLSKKTGFEIEEIKNEFYDYPFDLFWSVRKSPLKYAIYPLYPFFKLISREIMTVVCKKNTR